MRIAVCLTKYLLIITSSVTLSGTHLPDMDNLTGHYDVSDIDFGLV